MPRAPAGGGDSRAAIREWRDNWQRAGAVLERERWERLAELSDHERADMALDVLSLWRRDSPGDDGEGLLVVQRAFARVRQPH